MPGATITASAPRLCAMRASSAAARVPEWLAPTITGTRLFDDDDRALNERLTLAIGQPVRLPQHPEDRDPVDAERPS